MAQRVGPAGLAIRAAVRRGLADLAAAPDAPDAPDHPDHAATSSKVGAIGRGTDDATDSGRPLVLVACSGGPDSLALAAATAFVAPRLGLRAGAVVVDHGLQPDSAAVAQRAVAACRDLGLGRGPLEVVRVDVGAGDTGPEGAARTARYAALDAAAATHGAVAVLLGHTRDDQAESVLLGLLRGSGARSLSGMAEVRGHYRRPLLDLPRRTTRESCAELGLEPWTDPHNDDPAYARSRVRALLAELEERVGAGTTAGLARTADRLRADDEALEIWAERAYVDSGAHRPREAGDRHRNGPALDCAALVALPAAVRTRVIRRAVLAAGARSADLTSAHLAAVDALVTDWHGQGEAALPGPVAATRDCGRLLFRPPTSTEE